MISRFRQSSPKPRRARDSLRNSGDYPEFWWEEKPKTEPSPRDQVKNLSIDQMIAQDIRGFTEAISPVKGVSRLSLPRGYSSDRSSYDDDRLSDSLNSDYSNMLVDTQLSPVRRDNDTNSMKRQAGNFDKITPIPPVSNVASENMKAAKNQISQSLSEIFGSISQR